MEVHRVHLLNKQNKISLVPRLQQHQEGQSLCAWGRGVLGDPSPCWPVSGLQAQERLQSSVTGGGMSCSWKFSFWKMLLKAGPLWEPPNGLQLSLLRFWESSVRRASLELPR